MKKKESSRLLRPFRITLDEVRSSNSDEEDDVDFPLEQVPKEHTRTSMWVNAGTGEIFINPNATGAAIHKGKLIGAKLKEWLTTGLTHEVIHSNLIDLLGENQFKEMTDFWKNSTAVEKALIKRIYNRKWGKGPTDELALAHEMFRQRMERMSNLNLLRLFNQKDWNGLRNHSWTCCKELSTRLVRLLEPKDLRRNKLYTTNILVRLVRSARRVDGKLLPQQRSLA